MTNATNSIRQCEQILQGLMQQTQQSNAMYQQMMQQERQNAMQLEQLASREHQAVHVIQTALQGHQVAMQQMQHAMSLCHQLENAIQSQNNMIHSSSFQSQPYLQSSSYRGLQ